MNAHVELLKKLIDDKKGEDINVLDVTGRFPFADYFVIATAKNERLLKAVAAEIKENDPQFVKIEGSEESGWLIIECDDVIVHLFSPDLRVYYALETLWNQ